MLSRFLTPLIMLALAIAIFFGFTDRVLSNPVEKQIDEETGTQIMVGGVKALMAQKASLNEALANATKLKERIDQLAEDYNNIPLEDRQKLDKFLPDNMDNIQLIIDTNNIAQRNNMSIRGIKISTTADENSSGQSTPTTATDKSGQKADTVTLSFTTSASYAVFQKFIIDLSRSLRITDVSATTFSTSDKNIYDYQVEIKTYWVR